MSESSFRKFDYSLRPAKNIERKMLAEIFARLAVFRPTTDYGYVGFGSVYFTDYALFHRQLGLAPMFSMEADDEGFRRAQFNVPFDCVEVVQGKSTDCLPEIPFDRPTIVWLDYDYELSLHVLQDIQTVVHRQCEAAKSGVVLLVTVDVESKRLQKPKSIAEDELEDWPSDPVSQFRLLVTEHYLPANMTTQDLHGDKLAETYRRVCDSAIRSAITTESGWNYAQLANFRYADGAEMATFGGVLFKDEDRGLVQQASFGSLDFVKDGVDPFVIDTPKLTFHEMRELARHITEESCPKAVPITHDDFQKFKRLYRYFPAFVEAEL